MHAPASEPAAVVPTALRRALGPGRWWVLWAGLLLLPASAGAQLSGDLRRGQYGLLSGTQPAAGLLLTPWLYDLYSSTLVGPDGSRVQTNGASTNTLTVPGLSVWLVTPWEILGASFGVQLQLWGTMPSFDFPRLGATSTSYGFGDMYLKPVELGWHTTYVDVIAGFALWIPTGRYSPGAADNTGQGQWGYEVSAGATLWFDAGHHFNLALQALYDLYSPRRGAVTVGSTSTQLQTGNILYLQGGLGYSLLGGVVVIGVPYFVQLKVTEDTLPSGIGSVLPGIQAAKSWSIGLGAEIDLAWTDGDAIGFRWVQGFSGVNTTNGASFLISYTHAFNCFGRELY